MRFAEVASNVNPHEQVVLIILWSTFNILASLGFLVLFLVSLFTSRLRRNPVLLSFFAIFFFACASNTILTWTGYAFKQVPFVLCVVSGAFGAGVTVLQTGAAICLVIKV
jgi:hypothetical protein